jgi:hypothetical protein
VTSQHVLLPLQRLTGHMHGISCLSGLLGWPGLLSASLDQTVRSWQPEHEAGSTALLLLPAAEADAGTAHAGDAASSSAKDAGDGAAAAVDAAVVDAELSASNEATRPVQDSGPASVRDSATAPAQKQPFTGTDDTSAAPATAKPSAASGASTTTSNINTSSTGPSNSSSSRPVSTRHWKQFVVPGSRTFLPPLPDLSDAAVQQQAQLDVVALAEAIYPAQLKSRAAAAAGSGGASSSSSSSSKTAGRFRLFKLDAQPPATAQQQQQQCPYTCSSSSVIDAFSRQLSTAVGSRYSIGSWLPSMTADVQELLRQHEQALQQQQQQQQGSSSQHQQPAHLLSSSSSTAASGTHPGTVAVNQAAMMQYMLGDVGGFMRAAVAADVITPDVVALAAAGGSAAWGAAAQLAAAKLESVGQVDAAAVYLLAAGEPAAAAAAMR